MRLPLWIGLVLVLVAGAAFADGPETGVVSGFRAVLAVTASGQQDDCRADNEEKKWRVPTTR